MTHGGGSTETSSSDLGREMHLLDLATVLIRHWRLVVGGPLVGAAIATILSFVIQPTFTATTTFVPETRTNTGLPAGLAGIAGLAGEFGFSLGSDASRSPRFYADVLRSRELLERVLLSRYADPRGAQTSDSATLLGILEVDGRNSRDSLAKGVRKLSRLMSTRVDNPTGIVQLSVSLRWPQLAAATADRLLDYLDEFNAQTRQSQARERRKFVEQRIAAAESELQGVEEGLRTFYERNRSWQQSPQLTFEEGRLRRQVEIRQEVYLTLKREYETARIEEVNDTPVLTVIDHAVAPQRRTRPRRTLMLVLGSLLGAVVGVFSALASAYMDRVRREETDRYHDLSSVVQTARSDIGRSVKSVLKRRS